MLLRFVGGLTLTTLALSSCGGVHRPRILICPAELTAQLRREAEPGRRRELLFKSDYCVVVVERKAGVVSAVRHYRPEHTFASREHIEDVSLTNPAHISSLIIFDRTDKELGIAVQRCDVPPWKVHWFDPEELSRAESEGVLHLPPLE